MPSVYTGGTGVLIDAINNSRVEIQFGEPSEREYQCSCFSFLSDCEIEFNPISSGYCVVLLYSMNYGDNDDLMSDSIIPIGLATNRPLEEKIAHVLEEWNWDPYGPRFLTFLLKHDYSNLPRSKNDLKNEDRTACSLLMNLIKRCNFSVGIYLGKSQVTN